MELRPVERKDPRQSYLMNMAFNRGCFNEQAVDEGEDIEGISTIGAWENDRLCASVTVVHFQCHFGAHQIAPMGGIAGVACMPADRGKSYAGICLKRVLEMMRENGEYVSSLYPFSWDFYGNYGWAWVGEKREYSLPTAILRTAAETDQVYEAQPSDREEICRVYTAYAKQYRGMIIRDEAIWKRHLDNAKDQYTYTYIYRGESGIEGYVTFRHQQGDETHLSEFISLSPAAMNGLLGLMRRLDMQIKRIKFDAPGDDNLWFSRMHWEISTRLQPFNMARVVDISAALAALHPPCETRGKVIFTLRDSMALWNQGTWAAEYEGGQCVVKPSTEEAGIELDIQAFSQAYWGSPSLAQLLRANRLIVKDEVAYRSLSVLLGGPTMCMYDAF